MIAAEMSAHLFLLGLAGYSAVLMLISLKAARRQNSGEDFLLAGRQVSSGLTFGTTIATMIGTGTSMGAVGYAYLHGWSGVMYGIGGAVGILLTAWLFAPVRALRFMTMSEEVSYYAGASSKVKQLTALIIFLASLGWLAAHILGGALYLAWATGISLFAAKWILASAFTLFVLAGGYRAVVWTDSLMAIVLFAGFIVLAVFVLHDAGGVNSIVDYADTATQRGQLTTPGAIPALSLAIAVAVGVLAAPSFRQRIYSGASVSSIRKAFGLAAVVYLLFALVPAMLGIAASHLLPDLDMHQHAFTGLITLLLPPMLAVLVMLAGISATLSSASSDAIAAVSVLIRDGYCAVFGQMPAPDKAVLYSRLAVLAVSILALLLALFADDIIRFITSMIATLMSGLCVCCIAGRYWRRLNAYGAVFAIVSASVTSVLVLLNSSWLEFWGNPVIPALSAGFIFAVVVSLVTPVNRFSRQQALQMITTEREQQQGTPVPEASVTQN